MSCTHAVQFLAPRSATIRVLQERSSVRTPSPEGRTAAAPAVRVCRCARTPECGTTLAPAVRVRVCSCARRNQRGPQCGDSSLPGTPGSHATACAPTVRVGVRGCGPGLLPPLAACSDGVRQSPDMRVPLPEPARRADSISLISAMMSLKVGLRTERRRVLSLEAGCWRGRLIS
jgi:hypothetical protein